MKPKLTFVGIDKIKVGERFRETFGDLEGLTASIKEKGVLQPITLNQDLLLLAGERRYKAAQMAGLTEIPALIRLEPADEVDAREIELIENVFRLDFDWPEKCALIQEIDRLYKSRKTDWSGRKTAQLLSRSVADVSRSLQLARAIEVIPELRDERTADDALKILKKLEEQTITAELAKRQHHAVESGGLQKGITEMLKMARLNYHDGVDTFKGLAELRTAGRVDLIECDPPYGIDLTQLKQSKESSTSNVHTYNEIDKGDYPSFLGKLTKELYRVAGANCWLIFWFGQSWQHEVLTCLREAKWEVDEIPAAWVKTQGQTNQPELYLARAWEPFYLARKGKPLLVKHGRLNVFNYPGISKKYHPTERPVALIQEILETLGVVRQHVLVPFLGSGATLRAAYNLGMSASGWDISREYKDKFMLAVEEDARNLNGGQGENEGDE